MSLVSQLAYSEALHRRGQVLAATVNEQTIVPFVSQQLNNLELALSLAKRGNLPGAEALVGQNFDRLFGSGQFKEAAEAAAESPQVLHEAAQGANIQGVAGLACCDIVPYWQCNYVMLVSTALHGPQHTASMIGSAFCELHCNINYCYELATISSKFYLHCLI